MSVSWFIPCRLLNASLSLRKHSKVHKFYLGFLNLICCHLIQENDAEWFLFSRKKQADPTSDVFGFAVFWITEAAEEPRNQQFAFVAESAWCFTEWFGGWRVCFKILWPERSVQSPHSAITGSKQFFLLRFLSLHFLQGSSHRPPSRPELSVYI